MDGRSGNGNGRGAAAGTPSNRRRCAIAAAAALAVMAAAVSGGGTDAGAAVKRSDPLCPENGCAAIRCPRDQDACPLGLVPDGCGCCPYGVCGLGDAAECNAADKPCADNAECVKTEIGDAAETAAVYRCVCKENEPACGSDNRTYANPCRLNEAAVLRLGNNTNGTEAAALSVQYRGPCHTAPIIRSVPKNFAGTIGQPVVFDCEVKGYPVPSISWRFTDTNGNNKWLPGDDTLMAIQTRGGPDRLTVTSWVQIVEFRAAHAGNYTCLSVNSVDSAAATATLEVRKMT